jgi:hypothetical protein
MALWTDLVTPAELTGYTRAALADRAENRVSLAQFLPNNYVDDVVARITSGDSGLTDAAEYRAFDAETRIGGGGGGKRVTFDLPPLGKKERVSEYDQLRANGRDSDENVIDVLEQASIRRGRAVDDRVEIARGQALVTGKVTIAENGFVAELDFGRRGGNTVAPGTLWTSGSATPVSDIETWIADYVSVNGEAPGAMLTSTRVLGLLRRSAEFRTTNATLSIVTREAVQAVLADFGIPELVIYDRVVKVNGTQTRVIADDKVLFLPARVGVNDNGGTDLGETTWGRTLESMDDRYQIADGEQPGIVVGAYRDDDPLGVWVKGTAISTPALANPDLSYVADVA